jgi:NAD(P)-dependent dehydrogenase (short-subunit alcohol dehydrogenase family)
VDLGLKDPTAVVAGGGRGMALAAARCLADDGARVAIGGRTKDVLEKAAKDLTDRGSPDALAVVADTGDAAVRHVFDEIGGRCNGELNVLINAVGPGRREHSTTSPTSGGGTPSATARWAWCAVVISRKE